MSLSFDTVVIGGGPGGYVAAIRLAQSGLRTAIIEKGSFGGVCLNWGCVPSKALIHAAHTVHHLRHAEEFGVQARDISIDINRTRAWKDDIVGKLTSGVRSLLKGNGCEIIEGSARFLSPGNLEVKTSDGSVREIQFQKCIIATGAKPMDIGLKPDGEYIWGASDAVDLPLIPERLLVVGGGVIGLELGTVYAKLGSSVTIVELMDRLLSGIDRDLVRVVERRLKNMGVRICLKTMVSGLDTGDGVLRAELKVKDSIENLEFDRVLVAAGFVPHTENLNLEATGVETDSRGAIIVDSRMQTNISGIYAVGDVTGAPYLAHRAFCMGEIAAHNCAGKDHRYSVRAMPAAIFTDPEIAVAGLSEEEAAEKGTGVKTGKFMFAANGRALGAGEPHGFVKTVSDDNGKILGAGIVGLSASELIGELTLAIETGASLNDIARTVHAHPTLSEAVQESAFAGMGRALHAINRKPRIKKS